MKLADIRLNKGMQDFVVYQGLHVLCTLDKNNALSISHYTICLVKGREPMWALFTAAGKWLRWHGSREEIERAYPYLVWRRVRARWGLASVNDLPVDKRRAALELHFEKHAAGSLAEAENAVVHAIAAE